MQQTNLRLSKYLRTISQAASIIVFAIGCFVIIGWIFDITILKSVFPGFVTMKVNAALLFILAGASLYKEGKRRKVKMNKLETEGFSRVNIQESIPISHLILPFIVALIGLLTLIQYGLGVDFSIDQLLIKESANAIYSFAPGRMAFNTALNFFILGVAQILLLRKRPNYHFAQILSIAVFLVAWLAFLGYLYGISSFYGISVYTKIALHSAIAFMLLSIGILFACPDKGLMAVITSNNAGGMMARRLSLAVILIPPILSWFILVGYRHDKVNAEEGFTVIGVMNLVIFSILIWGNANSLNTIDEQRQKAEEELRQLNAELEERIERNMTELKRSNEQLASEIVERQQALVALQESEERFRQITNNIREVFWMSDPDKNQIIYINPAYEEVWGRTRESLYEEPKSFVDSIYEEDRDRIVAGFAKQASGEYDEQYRIIQPNGQERWIRDRAFPVRNTQGQVYRIVGIAEDISDRKQAESALQKAAEELEIRVQERTAELALANADLQKQIQERKAAETALQKTTSLQRAILDGANYTIISTSLDGTILTFNRAAVALLGYAAEEVVGTTAAIFHDIEELKQRSLLIGEEAEQSPIPNPQSPLFEVLVAKARLGEPDEQEWTYICKDGRRSRMLLSVTALYDAEGNITGFLGIGSDITESKKAQEELRESQQRLQAILDNSPAIIYLTDTQNKYQLVNRRYEELFQITKEQIVGKSLYDIWPLEIADLFAENNLNVLQTTTSLEIEESIPYDGEIHTYLSIKFPLYDSSGVAYGVCGISTDITQRKQAQEALQKLNAELESRVKERTQELTLANEHLKIEILERQIAEDRLQHLLTSSPAVIYSCKASNDYGATFISENVFSQLGYEAREFIEDSGFWMNHIHPEDRPDILAGLSNLFEQGHHNHEYRFLRPDGTYRWMHDELKLVRDEAGNPIELIGSWWDITERKLSEEERAHLLLREQAARELAQANEQRYRSLAEAMPQIVFSAQPDGNCDYFNQRWVDYTGLTLEESLGYKWISAVHPDDRQQIRRDWYHAVRKSISYESEHRLKRSLDGQYRWHLNRIVPVRDNDGQIVKWLGTSTDIHDRKQMESALRESEGRFRRVVDSNMIGINFWDVFGNVTEANDAFLGMIGYTREDLLSGKVLWKDMTPVEYQELDKQKLQEVAATGICTPFEKEFFRADGSRVPILIGGALLEENEYQGVCYIIDITERKQMEETLSKQAQELARSNAELEEFAYVASHDLQEPLRMVASYTQLLSRRYKGKLDEDADEFITFAVDGANRMQKLIKDLLEYSRVGTRGKEFDPVECEDVLHEAIANLQFAIDESNAIITYDSLPTVRGDSTQLGQLLQNLIGNAIKFHQHIPPRIHIGVEPTENEWIFSVRDNGIGMNLEERDRIFVIFQRLHAREAYPGTGIGLAICKKIVERHGGQIWVDSQVGQGSVFYFTIPRTGVH
ncbi:PAS domain S-box protein [Trichocoleus sp. FACHB-90]|uniref:PAS domain S-box protein n=1 Tax=Cyanophyceae TaxID=3028117 RepID=UPI00168401A2|nr:PAS domain S-box protein [Trichocoleus sp. FACHB-90]MBD1929674.1 PAS domain S-box protein [Trichocoleus sp. FACHB-90]